MAGRRGAREHELHDRLDQVIWPVLIDLAHAVERQQGLDLIPRGWTSREDVTLQSAQIAEHDAVARGHLGDEHAKRGGVHGAPPGLRRAGDDGRTGLTRTRPLGPRDEVMVAARFRVSGVCRSGEVNLSRSAVSINRYLLSAGSGLP